ncbi:DHH family phosphoesterase [Tindallia californiensis]|uniref:NanoRNase/pAp phosphatase, hydrolyzes c-di-AMP and oligoRNAs n=1 Tax=Tindallia californiensis TaxID=159292 RepID=A0A1H3NJ66_9FIRM|nr:exopolyphosphatase [Tindallia californiensis]SDY88485.1 nanoRNase/pAp phosphatase, hydrolyzes c-di-AMP and oligoRNAs [Tindallia californiensis]
MSRINLENFREDLFSGKKFRLVTRSDFDGLVCAVLLKELNILGDIKFVHPKDVQDGLVELSKQDITTNLPYAEGVFLAFDHHFSETLRITSQPNNHIIDADAKSAARVVYDFFGGKEAYPQVSEEMMIAVDKADAALFDKEEVLNPEGWNLMNFIMDARTGLGRFRNFTISNYDLMMKLIDHCREYSVEEILQLSDVQERVKLYFEQQDLFKEMMKRCTKIEDNIIITDLKKEETIYAGNRFIVYAMYPECNISIQIMKGFRNQNTVMTVGKSIFNRSSKMNIGELLLRYGGGGHANAGTCQVAHEEAEKVLREIIEEIRE